jgi:hypothetical protein
MKEELSHGTFSTVSDALALALMNAINLSARHDNHEEKTLVMKELSFAIEDVIASVVLGFTVPPEVDEEVRRMTVVKFWIQKHPNEVAPEELEVWTAATSAIDEAKEWFRQGHIDSLSSRYIIEEIYTEEV